MTPEQASLVHAAVENFALPIEVIAARLGVPVHECAGYADGYDDFGVCWTVDDYAEEWRHEYQRGYLQGALRRQQEKSSAKPNEAA